MADRGDTLYHIPTLNRWFLFASAFFTLTMVWTVLDDSSAEWKDYQREFRAMELEKAEEARAALAAEGLVEQRDSLAEAVAAAEAALTAEGSRLDELETAVYNAKDAFRNDETAYKSVVAELKWQIFNFEREASVKAPAEVEAQQQLIDDLTTESETLGKQVEVAAGNRAEAEAALTAYRASVADAEKALAVASRDLKRVEEKIESLDPSDIATAVANQIRDFPGLDFIGPNLKVQKLYFLRILRCPGHLYHQHYQCIQYYQSIPVHLHFQYIPHCPVLLWRLDFLYILSLTGRLFQCFHCHYQYKVH